MGVQWSKGEKNVLKEKEQKRKWEKKKIRLKRGRETGEQGGGGKKKKSSIDMGVCGRSEKFLCMCTLKCEYKGTLESDQIFPTDKVS